MRVLTIVALAASIVAARAAPALAQCAPGAPAGPGHFFASDVAHAYISEIEATLSKRGYYLGPVDGQVSLSLRAAICRFQSDVDQPETGIADQTVVYALRSGPKTLGPFAGGPAAPAADHPAQPKAASVSQALRDLQAALAAKGYYGGPVDGMPRPEMVQAVIAYQKDDGGDSGAVAPEPPLPKAAAQAKVTSTDSPR